MAAISRVQMIHNARNVTQYIYSVAYFYPKINDFKQHLHQMVYFDKRINLFIFSGEEA